MLANGGLLGKLHAVDSGRDRVAQATGLRDQRHAVAHHRVQELRGEIDALAGGESSPQHELLEAIYVLDAHVAGQVAAVHQELAGLGEDSVEIPECGSRLNLNDHAYLALADG